MPCIPRRSAAGIVILILTLKLFFLYNYSPPQKNMGQKVKDNLIPETTSLKEWNALSHDIWSDSSSHLPRYTSTKEGCDKNLEAFAEGGITELDMILCHGFNKLKRMGGDLTKSCQ